MTTSLNRKTLKREKVQMELRLSGRQTRDTVGPTQRDFHNVTVLERKNIYFPTTIHILKKSFSFLDKTSGEKKTALVGMHQDSSGLQGRK